jgi:hypothetical protein
VIDDQGVGQLDETEACLLRQEGELFDDVEFALVGGGAEAGRRTGAVNRSVEESGDTNERRGHG